MSHKLAKLKRLHRGQVEKELLLLNRLIEQDRLLRQMADALEAAEGVLDRWNAHALICLSDQECAVQKQVSAALDEYRAAQDEEED